MPAQKGLFIKIKLEFYSFDGASVTRKRLTKAPFGIPKFKIWLPRLAMLRFTLTLQLILWQSITIALVPNLNCRCLNFGTIAIAIVPKFKHWQFKHRQLRHYSFSAVVERAVPKIALNSTLPHLGTSFCFSQ